MMKKVYLIVSFMFLVNIGIILPSGAQTILLDKESSRPIVRASVFDEENHPVGLTDSNGFLPDLKGAKGIRITCLGYQTMETKVSDIGKELYLVPMDYPLKEVVVNSDSQYSRLKLTCYYRDFVVFGSRIYTDMLGGNTDLFYSDGICTIYIPRPGILSVTRRVNEIRRDVAGSGLFGYTDVEDMLLLWGRSMVDIVKNKEMYVTREEENVTTAYRKKKDSLVWEATIVRDSLSSLIYVDYVDGMAQSGKVRNAYDSQGRKISMKLRKGKDHIKNVFRMTPFSKVPISSLIAYNESFDFVIYGDDGEQKGCYIRELYPVEAEYLTKEEYKDEKKQKGDYTYDDIDRLAKEALVPDLTPEIRSRIERLRKKE